MPTTKKPRTAAPRKKATAAALPATSAVPIELPTAETVLEIVERLHSRGMPADLIRSLIEASEREKAAAGAIAYAAALQAFQAKGIQIIKSVHREFVNDNGDAVDYWYAPLPEVIAAVQPALHACGLVHSWRPVDQQRDYITIACRLTHVESGHFEEVALGGPPDESGDKTGAQAVTSTNTLLQRATLKTILGLAEQHDDADGRLGARTSDRKTKKTTAGPAPAPAPEFMSVADFARSLTSWRGLILTGQRSADDIVAMARTRKPLSPEQETELRAIEASAPIPA